MKYEGTRPSGRDASIPVYMFSVGKEELEILTKLLQLAYDNTPLVTEIMPYHGRLRNLTKVFGRLYLKNKHDKN